MSGDDCRRIRGDTSGDSPVLAELLLVGVVIVLTMVVATMVFDIGASIQSPAPQIQFDAAFDDTSGLPASTDDRLVITHEGGDAVGADRLRVVLTNVSIGGGRPLDANYTATANWSTATLTAGTSLTIDDESDLVDTHGRQPLCLGQCAGADLDLDRAALRVVWTPANGETNTTLWVWTGPDA